MKTNAIVRIVIYSLVILLLAGLLWASLGIGIPFIHLNFNSGDYTTGEGSADAAQIQNLHIEWAAGSIQIVTADTDTITFTESGNFSDDQKMVYKVKGDTLTIAYSNATVSLGFISLPSKDLIITVPESWVCRELELDGASLDVDINGLTVRKLDIDGAANSIHFTGSVDSLECDGASASICLVCSDRPSQIDLDGAACALDITLPEGCGFRVEMEGLSCRFDSDYDYTTQNGCQVYGDEYCKISADGVSCEITIRKAA